MSKQKVTVKRVTPQGHHAPNQPPHPHPPTPHQPQQDGCSTLLLRWIIAAAGIYLVATLLEPNIHVDSFPRAMIVAAVVGFLNIVIRPILFILTLPITILTLGLFLIVINAIVINIAASLLQGFEVASFGWAVIASVLISIFNLTVDNFTKNSRQPPP